MSYHRKYVETDPVPIESPAKHKYDEEVAEAKTPPLRWFWFYKNITLTGACLVTIAEIIIYIGEISALGPEIKNFFYLNICILAFTGASLAAYIYLLINLRKFKPFAYKLNMLIIVTNVVFVNIDDNYSQQQIIIRFILSALFAILNIIYFEKRRHLFIQNCDKTIRNRRIIMFSAIATILAAFTLFYLYPMNNQPTAQEQAAYGIEVSHNLDELSNLYNYDNKYAMIKDVENQYGTSLESYSFAEAFEFISTHCLGLKSYEEMQGKTYNDGTKIRTFTDYQEYVLDYVRNLPGSEPLY